MEFFKSIRVVLIKVGQNLLGNAVVGKTFVIRHFAFKFYIVWRGGLLIFAINFNVTNGVGFAESIDDNFTIAVVFHYAIAEFFNLVQIGVCLV